MSYRFPQARILLFAKAPRSGEVKTRLQPRLGQEGCLALYRSLLQRAATIVRKAKLAPMELWVTSNPGHEDFVGLCDIDAIFLQQGADLGQRMAHAADTALVDRKAEAVVIIGTDCPALDAGYLAQALTALTGTGTATRDVVLGPAEDGGYILVGLRRPVPGLFADIDWGSDRVLTQTLRRLERQPVRVAQLKTLWDVDREEDLDRLKQLTPALLP